MGYEYKCFRWEHPSLSPTGCSPEAGTLAGEAAENQGVGWRGTKVHVSEGLLGGGGGRLQENPSRNLNLLLEI